MDFSVVYLGRRFFYRLLDFFHHWYVDGSRAIGRRFMVTLTKADQSFAVAITLRHFFEPLYKDYSIVGRILGIFFRSVRVLIGGACYLLLALGFAVVYLIWLAIPAIILFYAAKNL
jgi:hypothetical protein